MKTNIHFDHISPTSWNKKWLEQRLQGKSKHILFVKFIYLFFFENRVFYEVIWKNMIKPSWPPLTLWQMRITCWIPQAAKTHSENIILTALHCKNGCTKAPLCHVDIV